MIRLLCLLRSLRSFCRIFSQAPLIVGLVPIHFAKRKYWRQLRETCGGMGLRHEPSEYYDEFGSLRGTVKGYAVRVTIDSRGTASGGTHIVLHPRYRDRGSSLELRRPKPTMRPERGIEDFATGSPEFDYLFRTRRGDPATARALAGARDLFDAFVLFYAKWMFRLHDFHIELPGGGFRCTLNYGLPFSAYVPPEVLKEILEDLAGLVTRFDGAISRPGI